MGSRFISTDREVRIVSGAFCFYGRGPWQFVLLQRYGLRTLFTLLVAKNFPLSSDDHLCSRHLEEKWFCISLRPTVCLIGRYRRFLPSICEFRRTLHLIMYGHRRGLLQDLCHGLWLYHHTGNVLDRISLHSASHLGR